MITFYFRIESMWHLLTFLSVVHTTIDYGPCELLDGCHGASKSSPFSNNMPSNQTSSVSYGTWFMKTNDTGQDRKLGIGSLSTFISYTIGLSYGMPITNI